MTPARVAVASLLACCALAGRAAADERVECAHAYEQTQRLRQKGELLASLDDAERCARATCPQLLQQECARWTGEIKSKLPTLVVRIRGADACTKPNAQIDITGA